MNNCRVQYARKQRGLPDFPCKGVGIVEYGLFAKTIDPRIENYIYRNVILFICKGNFKIKVKLKMEKKTVGIVIFIIGIIYLYVGVVGSWVIQYLIGGSMGWMYSMFFGNITFFVGILVTIIGLSIFLYYRSREQ